MTDGVGDANIPLGFAPAQVGAAGERGQVIFCRGQVAGGDDGCVDLVVDVEAAPGRRIVDVRYPGFPGDRWLLDSDRSAGLPDQLAGLARTGPFRASWRSPAGRRLQPSPTRLVAESVARGTSSATSAA